MSKFELIFRIAGEAYQQVVEYRRQMDYRVIRNQFERAGHAMIVSPSFGQVSEMPAMGDAVPWYGNTGTGYAYTLLPQAAGCALMVENVASGHVFLCREILPSLELHLPDDPFLKKYDADEIPRHAGYAFSENGISREILLSVTSDIYPILAAWPRYGEPLTQYEFEFHPISVGNQVYVRYVESSDVIDLTADIEW